MKVSVLTPIYKTDERFLREAIESVLGQTFRDFEFLLLDDCPEDDHAIRVALMHGISMWHPASMVRKSVLVATGARYEAAYTPVEDYML